MLWIFIYENRFNSYENKKLIEQISIQNLDNDIKVLDPKFINVLLSDGSLQCFYKGQKIKTCKSLLIKLGCMLDKHTIDIASSLEDIGVDIINGLEYLEVSMNKFRMNLWLKKYNIPFIKTLKMTGKNEFDLKYISENFSYPLIIKSKVGSLGKGIYKISSKMELKNIFEQINLLDVNYEYLIQEYIEEAKKDFRVVVFNGEIKYVMKREAQKGEFKSNYYLGSKISLEEPEATLLKIVKEIYQVFPLNIMGIDLIKKGNQYIVCEINSNPGFKGKDDLGDDFINDYIEHLKKMIEFY